VQSRDGFSGQLSECKNGRVVCPNCGGDFSIEDSRCPYCDALNPQGAEKAYMNTLEDLMDETEELAEDAEEGIETAIKSNARWILILAIAVLSIIVVSVAAIRCADSSDERREVESYQTRENFRSEHFPEFDRLYEEGDDAVLSAYVWSLMNEPGFDAVFSWKHIRCLEAYDDWEALNAFGEEVERGQPRVDDYAWATSVAIRLACLDAEGKRSSAALTKEEEKRVAGYRDYAWRFLQDMLQMNAEEVEAFAVSVQDSQGNTQIDKVKEGLEQRFGQLGAAS